MHLTTVLPEVVGLHVLLAVIVSASLLTTTHARIVSESSEADHLPDRSSGSLEGQDEDTGMEADDDDDEWPVLCPPNNYFNVDLDDCTECSSCPINHYVIQPCHRFQDSLCAVYYPHPQPWLQNKNADTSADTDTDSSSEQQQQQQHSSSEYDDSSKRNNHHNNGDNHDNKKNTRSHGDGAGKDHSNDVIKSEDSSDWRSLSMMLLVVVLTIFTCFLCVIFVLCYMRIRAYNNNGGSSNNNYASKQIVCDYGPAPKMPPHLVEQVV